MSAEPEKIVYERWYTVSPGYALEVQQIKDFARPEAAGAYAAELLAQGMGSVNMYANNRPAK